MLTSTVAVGLLAAVTVLDVGERGHESDGEGEGHGAEHQIAPWVPFILSFSILALATAILIITNVRSCR